MSEPHVLFLALGGNRRRAAEDEATAIVARGGSATIALRWSSGWRRAELSDKIRVIDVRELELRHAWMPAEQFILRRLPRGAFRLAGRGPLRQRSERGLKAYQQRVEHPLHQRVFLPMLRRGRSGSAEALIRRQLGDAHVDLLVVSDPASMPTAVALLRDWPAGAVPPVAYGIDHLAPAVPAPLVRQHSAQRQGAR